MSHTTRAVAACAAAAFFTLPAAGSHAAAVSVDQPCYADPSTQRVDHVQIAGSGFAPASPFELTLDGRPVPGATGQAGPGGTIAGTVTAPALPGSTRQHTFALSVQDGGAPEATTGVTVSRLLADFTPRAGDPATLKVRFRLYGFALQGERRPRIYVHYLDPRGRLRRTVRLGVGSGPCGRLKTRSLRLFPFRVTGGTWHLQFDTTKRFRLGTAQSSFLFYTLGVAVSRGRG